MICAAVHSISVFLLHGDQKSLHDQLTWTVGARNMGLPVPVYYYAPLPLQNNLLKKNPFIKVVLTSHIFSPPLLPFPPTTLSSPARPPNQLSSSSSSELISLVVLLYLQFLYFIWKKSMKSYSLVNIVRLVCLTVQIIVSMIYLALFCSIISPEKQE